jgi:hypothetical protein
MLGMRSLLVPLIALASLLAGCAVDEAPPAAEAVSTRRAAAAADEPAESDELPLPSPRRMRGRLRVETDDVRAAVRRIEREAVRRKATILHEQVASDGREAYSAGLHIRLAEAELQPFVSWLDEQLRLAVREVELEDARGSLAEVRREIAAREASVRRLEELVGGPERGRRLDAERELGRVRRELARLKEAERDFVAADGRAVLELSVLKPQSGGPAARMRVGLRATQLDLADPPDEGARRQGFGLSLGTVDSHEFSFDIDVFAADPDRKGDRRALLTTLGGSVYSEYFGGGRRDWLNPLLGFRVGYGSAAGHAALALGIELGLELYKRRPFSLTLFGRSLALLRGDGASSGAHAGVALLVPF